MSGDDVSCPDCDGAGTRGPAIVCSIAGDRLIDEAPCLACSGSGRVDAGYEARREVGRHLARIRRRRGVTLREEAARLGVRPSLLSAIEQGTHVGEIPSPELAASVADFAQAVEDARRGDRS